MNSGTLSDPKWIDGVILRRAARREWTCWGDGARRASHARGCAGGILIGEAYAEYVAETPGYQSGSRHSMVCAEAFLTRKPT